MATITGFTETITVTATTATVTKVIYGTLTITLPAWTFDGTGVMVDVLEDGFTLGDLAFYDSVAIDTVLFDDQLLFVFPLTVTDTVSVSDAATPEQISQATGTVQFTEQVALQQLHTAVDGVKVREQAMPRLIINVADTVTFTEAAAPVTAVAVSDTFTVTEATTLATVGSVSLSASFTFGDAVVSTAISESAAATATFSDEAVGTVVRNETVTDQVTFDDLVTSAWRVHDATLTDTMAWDDALDSAGSTLTGSLSDTVQVQDSIWARDYTALAWVLNTETGGVNTYDNFGFDSLAQYNGVLYATSPDGIHALDADTDAGRRVTAHFKTGFLDMGRGERKRLSDLYVSYTGGALECTIETYPEEEAYTYEMEERDAEAPRNNRIRIGKGLSSRYWRFTFSNVSGADFQIQDITAEIGVSDRRL